MIKPLPGYCLIEPIEDDKKTSGGVYLPESSQDKPSKGKVVALTQHAKAERWAEILNNKHTDFETVLKYTTDATIGDIVIYKKWTNQEVDHEGKKYLLVKFDELLAIIE